MSSPTVYFSRFCHTLNSLIQLGMLSFGTLNDLDRLGNDPWLSYTYEPMLRQPGVPDFVPDFRLEEKGSAFLTRHTSGWFTSASSQVESKY